MKGNLSLTTLKNLVPNSVVALMSVPNWYKDIAIVKEILAYQLEDIRVNDYTDSSSLAYVLPLLYYAEDDEKGFLELLSKLTLEEQLYLFNPRCFPVDIDNIRIEFKEIAKVGLEYIFNSHNILKKSKGANALLYLREFCTGSSKFSLARIITELKVTNYICDGNVIFNSSRPVILNRFDLVEVYEEDFFADTDKLFNTVDELIICKHSIPESVTLKFIYSKDKEAANIIQLYSNANEDSNLIKVFDRYKWEVKNPFLNKLRNNATNSGFIVRFDTERKKLQLILTVEFKRGTNELARTLNAYNKDTIKYFQDIGYPIVNKNIYVNNIQILLREKDIKDYYLITI